MPALYNYTGEVYPTHIRSTGVGVCAGVGRLAGIGTAFVATGAVSSSKTVLLSLYVLGAVVGGFVTAKYPYETAKNVLADTSEEHDAITKIVDNKEYETISKMEDLKNKL